MEINTRLVEISKEAVADKAFVAGDISTSEKTVVYYVQSGKEVARSVNEYLGGNK